MVPSLIITFRETLEAALVIGVVLGYLDKTNQEGFKKYAWYGAIAAIITSILGAYLFEKYAGGFSGRTEEIFEGVVMLLGATLLTIMIFWMMKRKRITEELREEVKEDVANDNKLGLFSLVFVSVLREGIEVVIFLKAIRILTGENNLLGAVLGILIAIVFGYVIFFTSKKINMKKFFSVSGILLILFAAGLFAHGIHELQEARIMPIIIEHAWDINPAITKEGVYPLFHEKGHIGSIAKGLLGYNGNPSLIEVLSYLAYLVFASLLWKKYSRPLKQKVEIK